MCGIVLKPHILYGEYNIFCFKILWEIFKTRSIIYATGTNIYIYILEPVYTWLYGDAAELIHGFIGAWKNGYRKILSADIKYYLSCITKKSTQ